MYLNNNIKFSDEDKYAEVNISNKNTIENFTQNVSLNKTPAYHQVSSGAPDISVNADQCKFYADETEGLTWKKADSWSHFHKGCSVYTPNGNVYFNNKNTGKDCGADNSNHNCIQMIPLSKGDCKKFSNVVGASYSDIGIWLRGNSTSKKMAPGCLYWKDSGDKP